MRAVMLEVPQALLDERRARRLDKSHEMWDGELHMVPPPSDRHQEVRIALLRALLPLAKTRGLVTRLGVGADTVDGALRLTWEGGSAET